MSQLMIEREATRPATDGFFFIDLFRWRITTSVRARQQTLFFFRGDLFMISGQLPVSVVEKFSETTTRQSNRSGVFASVAVETTPT